MTNEIMSTDQPTPLAQMQRAKAIAKEIAATVGHLIVNIQGRQYPTVAWWQAVGWAFNVTSTEVEVVKQATEDGIRDIGVTGVQTCALPISNGVG